MGKWNKTMEKLPEEEGLYLVEGIDKLGERNIVEIDFWTNTSRCASNWRFNYEYWRKIPKNQYKSR